MCVVLLVLLIAGANPSYECSAAELRMPADVMMLMLMLLGDGRTYEWLDEPSQVEGRSSVSCKRDVYLYKWARLWV
jgi:hypothetical protein